MKDLHEIDQLIQASGYAERIKIDPSVVRGLEYYTGPVYEVELLIETKDDKGRPVRFGSVGGGGRYDGLVSRFMGQPVPATGFSIGVSRLQAALAALGKLGDKTASRASRRHGVSADDIADAQKFVAALRNADIRAELYLGNPKHNLGQQMKYADRRGSPCAVIQGPDEKAQGVVQIKDLIVGADIDRASKDRDEYLKKQAEAQFAVKESELVEAVEKLLKRHKLGIGNPHFYRLGPGRGVAHGTSADPGAFFCAGASPICMAEEITSMKYLTVRHETHYRYSAPVSFGTHRLMLRPRDSHDLRLVDAELTLSPPGEMRWMHDVFGNSVAQVEFAQAAPELLIV